MTARVDICRICGETRKRHTDRLSYCATVGCYERDRAFVTPPPPPRPARPRALPVRGAVVGLGLLAATVAAYLAIWGMR